MKEKFKEKIIPSSYRARLLEESFYLRQGDLSVIKYMLKFEEIIFRYGFQIDHLPIIYMFYNGLRLDFKKEMILHVMKSIKETFFGFRARIVSWSTFK